MLYLATFAYLIQIALSQGPLRPNIWKKLSQYPEARYLTQKSNTAISFSGGGARAYVCAIGFLAGLHDLGLTRHIKYIGGISGGTWAVTTYTYAQNTKDSDLLGPVIQPTDITFENLNDMSPKCARGFSKESFNIAGLPGLRQGFPAAWAHAIQKMYLDPAGIRPNTRYSWSNQSLSEILQRNPQLSKYSFLLPANEDRPFPVVGGALGGPAELAPFPLSNNSTMIEFTPLYIGTQQDRVIEYTGWDGVKLSIRVGGAVESFAFARKGSQPASGLTSTQESGVIDVPAPDVILDLKYVATCSTYVPGIFFDSLPFDISYALGLEMDYWSPASLPTPKTTVASQERMQQKHGDKGKKCREDRSVVAAARPSPWLFADGGALELTLLIPFLRRRVDKIVLVINSETQLQPSTVWNVFEEPEKPEQCEVTFASYFGILATKDTDDIAQKVYNLARNQVFSHKDFPEMISLLQASQQRGDSIIATMNLTTVENTWQDIPAGVNTQLTVVYLGSIPKWENLLQPGIRDLIQPTKRQPTSNVWDEITESMEDKLLENFPNFGTTGGDISAKVANLLANMMGWVVTDNAALFKSIFTHR